jgi:hypothetical protein
MLSVCAEAVVPSQKKWMEWDVTNHVKDAIRNGFSNVDFLLMGSSEYYVEFYSRDDVTYYPHLLVDGTTTIKSTKDSYLKSSSSADNNYGSAKLLCNYKDNPDISSAYRSLISIPLSNIENGEVFKLKLYPYYYQNISLVPGTIIRVYKLTRSDWVETEVTWNIYKTGSPWTTAGGDYVAEVEDLPTPTPTPSGPKQRIWPQTYPLKYPRTYP